MSLAHPEFLRFDCAATTHIGQRRENNEDAMLLMPQHGVFCVADGMGGGAYGEVASEAVVETLERSLDARDDKSQPDRPTLVDEALNEASRLIHDRAAELDANMMGTTAVVLAFDRKSAGRATTLHVGDSRAYRYRYGRLTRLTRDHSVAEVAGIRNKKSLPRMFRGVVTRAIGTSDNAEVEHTSVRVRGGDLFLLCSDGLTGMLPSKIIARLIRRNGHKDIELLAKILTDAANDAGGKDNITVVLVRV